MNKLLSMSDTKLDEYVSLFEQKQQMAQGVAEKFYKGEFDAMEKAYTGQLPEFLACLLYTSQALQAARWTMRQSERQWAYPRRRTKENRKEK